MADKVILVLLFTFLPAVLGEYCYEKQWLDNDRVFYCSSGCCGSDYDRYCCWDGNLTGAAIAGIVVGCLLLVAIVVGTIIACYCCCRRQRAQQGQVVTACTTGTTVVASQQNFASPYPVTQPPPYGQPQQMGYTSTGYPTPATTNIPPPPYTQ